MNDIIRPTSEDLEKKAGSYPDPEHFKEEEVIIWHEITGFLVDVQYRFSSSGSSINKRFDETMKTLKQKRKEFQGIFDGAEDPKHRNKIIGGYAAAIKKFEIDVFDCLQKIKDPDNIKIIQSTISTIFSIWSGYFNLRNVFDLEKQLDHSSSILRRKLNNKGIEYLIKTFPKKVITSVDYFIVVNNLVGNALKYAFNGQKDKAVIVSGRDEPAKEQFLVSVVDNGSGICQNDLPYIFDKSYSPNQTRYGHGLGRGLGLYICRKIVEENGGTIEVKTEDGCGSAFNFSIPYCRLIK